MGDQTARPRPDPNGSVLDASPRRAVLILLFVAVTFALAALTWLPFSRFYDPSSRAGPPGTPAGQGPSGGEAAPVPVRPGPGLPDHLPGLATLMPQGADAVQRPSFLAVPALHQPDPGPVPPGPPSFLPQPILPTSGPGTGGDHDASCQTAARCRGQKCHPARHREEHRRDRCRHRNGGDGRPANHGGGPAVQGGSVADRPRGSGRGWWHAALPDGRRDLFGRGR